MSASILRCTPEQAIASLQANELCQLVDVREFAEFETERAPGSKHMPLSTLDQHTPLLSEKHTYYILCRSGKRATMAAEKLKAAGIRDVRIVDGGLLAWAAAGHPVEKPGKRNTWALDRQVRFVAGLLVAAGALLSVVSPWFIGLSGFVGAGLVYAAVTDDCPMAMMLAKAPWNQGKNETSCNVPPAQS